MKKPTLKGMRIPDRILSAHNSFAIIALLFGAVFVYVTPPLWGLDEVAHFNRVYQITDGHFFPTANSDGSQDTRLPENIVELNYFTYGDLINNKFEAITESRDVDDPASYDKLLSRMPGEKDIHAPIVATYSPVAYIGSVAGMAIARGFDLPIGGLMDLSRMGSLLFYITSVYLGLYILRYRTLKWVFFIVVLMPSPLSLASVISADGAVIGLSMLLLAGIIELCLRKTKVHASLVAVILIVSLLLSLTKFNYVFLSLAIILIPARHFGSRLTALAMKSAGVLMALVVAILYTKGSMFDNSKSASPRPDGLPVDAGGQMEYVFHHPLHFAVATLRSIVDAGDKYIQSLTAYVGWNESPFPMLLIFAIIAAISIAALAAQKEIYAMRKEVAGLALLSLLGIGSVFGSLYLVFTPVGFHTIHGVQGRYFIPFIVGIVMVGVLLARRVINIDFRTTQHHPGIQIIFTTLMLAISVGYYMVSTY